jgi:RING-box protein 1
MAEKESACATFELIKVEGVASWAYKISNDNCAICKNRIGGDNLCLECETHMGLASGNYETCNVAWGTCNHAFHHHCLGRWLVTRNVCPLCNQEWNFAKYE